MAISAAENSFIPQISNLFLLKVLLSGLRAALFFEPPGDFVEVRFLMGVFRLAVDVVLLAINEYVKFHHR